MTIFECEYCAKTFPASRDMKRHVLTHTGEKPHKCVLCDRTFARYDNLQLHSRRIHFCSPDEAKRKAMPDGSSGAQPGVGAGPKRSRLSLKNRKSSGKASEDQTPQKEEESPAKQETPVNKRTDLEQTHLQDEPRVAVASFGNLGNTCFLNSVLEVLRFTPGFVPNISYLSKELLSAHREKLVENELESDDVEVSGPWRLVRSLSKLFVRMNKAEENFEEGSDPYDLVMYPSKLLDIVREMNPMFEGNLQHDAQEMLRCLLCYIQDATNELVRYRTDAPETEINVPEKLNDVCPAECRDTVELNDDVDMSKNCDFNYDLKHLTPIKTEVQMNGGARPRAKASTAATKKKGKVPTKVERSEKGQTDSDVVTSTKNATGSRTRQVSKKEPEKVTIKRGRPPVTKSAPKDADVENRPVHENVLENLGKQTEVSISVDKEGSITLSPRKDTTVLLSPSKNGVVTLSVKKTAGSSDNSKSNMNSDADVQAKVMIGTVDNMVENQARSSNKNVRDKKSQKKNFANVFETFVVEKTESLKYGYVPTMTKSPVVPVLNGDGDCGSLGSDDELEAKLAVNKTERTYSRKNLNVASTVEPAVISVASGGDGDAPKKDESDWLNREKQSPASVSTFVDAFANLFKNGSLSKSNSGKLVSPKKETSPNKSLLTVDSEKLCTPISCEIPPNTSVMCPNGVSPKLPASLSPTVKLSQLGGSPTKQATKRINLSAQFDECVQEGKNVNGDGSSADSVIVNRESPCEQNGIQDACNAMDSLGIIDKNTSISPVKLRNSLSPEKSARLSTTCANDVSAASDKISPSKSKCLMSPCKSNSNTTSPVKSPKVHVTCEKPECCVQCPEKDSEIPMEGPGLVNGVLQTDINSLDAASVDSPTRLPVSPQKRTSPRGKGATPVEKNVQEFVMEVNGCEVRVDVSEIQDYQSKKRSLTNIDDANTTDCPAKRQRHGSERVQTDLFSHFGKRRTVRRLGMRGGVIVKDEPKSPVGVSLPGVESVLNGHSLGMPISHGASGLLNEELDKLNSSGAGAGPGVITDDMDGISPIKHLDMSANMTPVKNSIGEDCCIHKVRKSLDFSSRSPMMPGAKVDNDAKPGDEVVTMEEEPTETIHMSELVKDAMGGDRKAVVCLEKCDSVVKKTRGKRLIESEYDEERVQVVENMFQGMVVLKTRCLECEFCTARNEDFQDVSIPLPSRTKAITNDESDANKGGGDGVDGDAFPSDDEDIPDVSANDWMLSAMAEVEQLRDENKYYCEQCSRLVEAQRFMQYDVIPDILSFHIKRFAACTSILGGVSKLTDHVATPFTLPCFRATCPKPCPVSSHSYSLYGIIMHSGLTITAGHYTAYVKVPTELSAMNKKSKEQDMTEENELSSVLRLDNLTNQWLECDDDVIRPLSEKELQRTLDEGDTCATPYVLFYRRSD